MKQNSSGYSPFSVESVFLQKTLHNTVQQVSIASAHVLASLLMHQICMRCVGRSSLINHYIC